jgi:hypothetical protein
MESEMHYNVHKSPPLVYILHKMNAVSTLICYWFKIHYTVYYEPPTYA